MALALIIMLLNQNMLMKEIKTTSNFFPNTNGKAKSGTWIQQHYATHVVSDQRLLITRFAQSEYVQNSLLILILIPK
jgi:hypothetical protein